MSMYKMKRGKGVRSALDSCRTRIWIPACSGRLSRAGRNDEREASQATWVFDLIFPNGYFSSATALSRVLRLLGGLVHCHSEDDHHADDGTRIYR